MLIWGFSGVLGSCIGMPPPTQANGENECHKEMQFIQGKLQNGMLYWYKGSERSVFLCAPISLVR